MNNILIETEEDYYKSLKRIKELWGVKNTPFGDELDSLVMQVESYEMKQLSVLKQDN